MRKDQHYSGIGGEAVVEGVMMQNGDKMAISVMLESGEIKTKTEDAHRFLKDSCLRKVPIIRGIISFIDSLSSGMKAINYSSYMYCMEEDDEEEEDESISETMFTVIVMVVSVILAVGIFVMLPVFLTGFIEKYVTNSFLLAFLEGIVRLAIFIGYMLAVTIMKDMRRMYGYHGAEHKCINCIENGKELTVENVMKSSRFHKRCGSSFIVLTLLVSIVIFSFINVENYVLKIFMRLLLLPLIAGVSYEFLRYAGRHNNLFVDIISAPGVWLQHITTRNPDENMVKTAIASVEAVFDWEEYLDREFGKHTGNGGNE